jgi:hypothetical protein
MSQQAVAPQARSGARPQAHRAVEALTLLLVPQPPAEALEVLRAAAHTWLRHEGRLSLDRALGLPSGTQFRRAQRNHYIMAALRLVPGESETERAHALHQVLARMAGSGAWRRWRRLGGQPADAAELDRLAFEILSKGKDPSVPSVPSARLLRWVASLTR